MVGDSEYRGLPREMLGKPLATYNSTLLPVHLSTANRVTVEYALLCRDHRLKLNHRLVHDLVRFVRSLP